MAFNPALPANNSLISAAELRDQFNALKALVDTLDGRITALEDQIPGRALMPTLGEFDPNLHDPPTAADVLEIRNYLHDLAAQLEGANW